jgi:hypothetical protein
MKRTILFLLAATTTFSCLFAQTSKNPFSKLGYKKHISYTSSKGQFEEFHGNPDVVEIGSVYFNTKIKKVVGYVNEEKENAEVATATSAMSVDPLCEKYYWITPYAYCMNNPVKYVDPDGRVVRPAGTAELTMIQNTLPKDAQSYVRLDNNGLIDQKLLNSYAGQSQNFSSLKTMVNSNMTVDVKLDDKFTYADPNGQTGTANMSYIPFDPKYGTNADKDLTGTTMGGTSTGESGVLGKTLFPDKDGMQNSPNGNIIVVVNKNLSPEAAAEMYSHEGNGHALLYIQNGGKHKDASHQPVNGLWIEGNTLLKDMIINSKKETIKNMQGQ